MLVPVKQLYPYRLVTPGEIKTSEIELNLPVSPILYPKLFIKNTSATESVRVELTHLLDLGISDDPLLTGTFPTVLVDEPLDPLGLRCHSFLTSALDSVLTRHTLLLETAGTLTDVIVQVWIEGLFEESLTVTPAFEPIFI